MALAIESAVTSARGKGVSGGVVEDVCTYRYLVVTWRNIAE